MTYQEDISQIKNVTVADLIKVSSKYVPADYRRTPWAHPELDHGCAILSSEGALCAYMAAYGEMHTIKCKSAFRSFPFEDMSSTIEIIDWGCGQGIGTACFIEMLEERGKLNLLRKVTLIEPSHAALQRAVFHVQKLSGGSTIIIPIEQYLPGNGALNEIDGVHYEMPTVVHIFSNILDINSVNLGKLTSMLPSANHRQFIMCVGPQNTNNYRIDRFVTVFRPTTLLADISSGRFGTTSSTHREFGCHAKCFEYNNTVLHLEAMKQIVAPISICGRPVIDDYDPMMAIQNNNLPISAMAFMERLQSILTDKDYLYIKPNINGDSPDIVVLRPSVGIFIFQIFDYNLTEYGFAKYKEKEKEKINYSIICNEDGELAAPAAILSKYQENLIRLHMERTAENIIVKRGYFSIVKTIGFFPHNTTQEINDFYKGVDHKYRLFYGKDLAAQSDLSHFAHEIGFDSHNTLFDSTISENFVRIVSPGWHSYKEGIPIKLIGPQLSLAKSEVTEQKIKGTAGSGKTMVMAHRAVSAQYRTNKVVLLLTFNLALVNYIKYRIGQVREDFAWDRFYITNYHQFIKSVANNIGLSLKPNSFSNTGLFTQVKDRLPKYSAIFIDEVQDYQPEWLHILHDCFLAPDGEFVVFGDSRQNIYGLEPDKNGDVKIGVIPGIWNGQLDNGHRFKNGQLNILANKFQEKFFNNPNLSEQAESQTTLDFGSIQYMKSTDISISNIASICAHIIRSNNLPVDNTVILSETHDVIRNIDEEIRGMNIITLTTTEKQDQYNTLLQQYDGNKDNPLFKDSLEDLRRTKKVHFRMKDRCMKLSTVHSYKGWEAENVILIIEPEYTNDDRNFVKPEVIYTGITRARNNLYIVNMNNPRYDEFFRTVVGESKTPAPSTTEQKQEEKPKGDTFPLFDGDLLIKERRPFSQEEIDAVNSASIVKSQYGKSVCFKMKTGGMTFLPLSESSLGEEGDSVNLRGAELLTLEVNNTKEIVKIAVKPDGITSAKEIIYDGWIVKERHPFSQKEIDAVDHATIVASEQGNKVCFIMKSGGMTFIPLSKNSRKGIGEYVDLQNCSLLTLIKQGELQQCVIECLK